MAIQKLIYTDANVETSQEHPNTMVLMVEDGMYQKYKGGDKSIPLGEVVSSYKVFKYANPGKSGKLGHPSKREMEDTFGTSRDHDIVLFMLEKGKLHGKTELEKGELHGKMMI
eukprot:CAMPEP_0198148160 /NCGR_PEP_ID=MMETSP1443-20131203/40185_1 /TAXON_ID=186043 /ORGANISM="Entomoneis sp., Strain CCMP2396" /LENGTH=112 /DNA_ID=CAMNT_0043812777 /DNA_START=60 /DNA_END=398 /DNA_ORIENTATION=+